MTIIELQELFRTQLICEPRKVFYMKQQGSAVSILSHDVDNNTFQDLMNDLVGYTYQESAGNDNWPLFVKDEV
jgi:hypothetical protein